MRETNAEVIIVGAGICGLMAANVLVKSGRQVIVLDKGSGIGGRMATRRIGPGQADHGAQFFTVRSQEFRNWVSQWQYEKLVYIWSMGWSHGSLQEPVSDGHPRYVVVDGMNNLPKHLAQDLEHVYTGVQVTTATAMADSWVLTDAEGEVYTAGALLLTPPVPQSLELLRAGGTRLDPDDKAVLERIDYAPCLSGLFWVDGEVHLPDPGAVQLPDGPISWIADNQRKGISRGARLITVHAAPDYSQQLWGVPDSEVLEALRSALKPYIDPKALLREAQLKRWRYSLPTKLHDEPFLTAHGLPTLLFAGDAFGGARVEGATLSGLAAGRALAKTLMG